MSDAVVDELDVPLGGGLEMVGRRRGQWQLVVTPDGRRPVGLQIDPVGRRCRLGLAVLGGARIVDVSRDPAAFFNALRNAADHVGEPRERWASAVGTGLDRLGRAHGWWDDRPPGQVEHIALVAAWPLLRRSDLLSDDHPSLPRWAAGLCAGPELRPAVARALGDRASRRVTRLVGERLTGRPDWWPLALVLAMPRLDAGQAGDVLVGCDGDFRCSDDQFALMSRAVGSARPDLAIRLLQSVAREGSPQRLLDGLDGLARARELIPRLPTTISSLELCVAETLATAPPSQVPVSRRPDPPRPRQRRARVEPARPAAPPPARQAAPSLENWKSTGRFDHPPAWKELDRVEQGEVQLRLPGAVADLNRWGFELGNCLGSYRAPVDEGRSLVLGIFVRGNLSGAVEVDPAKRRIVQISSIKSRPLPRATRETVTAMLLARGAVTRA